MEVEKANFMKQLLEHAKVYETQKTIFSDIWAIIKYNYEEIINEHIGKIFGTDLYKENLEVLRESIIKQLDEKFKHKPKKEKVVKEKALKAKLTKEERIQKQKEKEEKKREKEEKKKERERKILSGELKVRPKKDKSILPIPILFKVKF